MPEGQVLEFAGLSKRFGSVLAVDNLTARVEPGAVTGFLGPNGAGKTTTLRMLLGLVRPSAGQVTIGGVPYAKLAHPLQTVGAVLEASSFHPGRSAANHLRILARAARLPDAAVDQALGTVGLADVAGRRVGGYSLGMRQRLGLAAALLGDPGVLVLDEPVNGLDPEGITWMRGLLQELARQGRTVLMSSHLLAEVQQTVDRLMIISAGRLVFQGGLEDLTDPNEYATVVDAPDRAALTAALDTAGVPFEVLRSGLVIRNPDVAAIGRVAADAGIALSLLQRRGPALEDVFFELVNGLRVHSSAQDPAIVDADAAAGGADTQMTASAAESADAPTPASTADPAAEVDDHAGAVAAPAAATEPAADETADATGIDDAAEAVDVVPAALEQEQVTTAAPSTSTVYAVASTGVIDVIPPQEDVPAEPEPTPEVGQAPHAEPTPEPEQTLTLHAEPAPEPEQTLTPDAARELAPEPEPEPEPAAATEPTGDRDEVVAGEPDALPPDDWRQEEEKTQSDLDADAFFHSFDETAGPAASDTDAPSENGGDQR